MEIQTSRFISFVKRRWRWAVIGFVVCIIFIAMITRLLFAWEFQHEQYALSVDDAVFTVWLADTPKERARGLQHVKSFGDVDGMVFVFSEDGQHPFWMKNTLVPIDFVWVDDGRVVDLTTNVQPQLNVPDDQLTSIVPTVPVDQVLELQAGLVEEHQIVIGDTLSRLLPL